MTTKQSAWRSPWILAIIGMFVIFVLANIVMIMLGRDTHPDLVVDNYYERGEDYEENMLKRMAKDPGWKMQIEAPEFVDVAVPAQFALTIMDKAGQPIVPDAVTFFAYRPSGAEHDFSQPMRSDGPGRYVAEVSFPLKGVWDILAAAKWGDDEYQASYRLSAGVK